MIYLKIFGGISLIISSFQLYKRAIRRENSKLEQLDAYMRLIQYIRNNIEYYLLPINKILDNCDNKIISKCLNAPPNLSISNLSQLYYSSDILFSDDIARIIEGFCTSFGNTYKNEQITMCEVVYKRLIEEKAKLLSETKNKNKVRFAISLAAPLLIIILLI